MRRIQTKKIVFYLLFVSIVFVSALSRLLFNGLYFNFDFGLYQPDGAHYLYRTLVFLGQDSISASNQATDWYRLNGYKNNIFDPGILRPENFQLWGLVSPRLLYPLLSIPFVWLMGAPGMLVVPMMSYLVLCIICYRITLKYSSQFSALLLVFAVTISPTVLRWMISNITDGLLCALFAVVAYILTIEMSSMKFRIWLVLLILATSLTRFCIPVWIAISVILFINRQRQNSLLVLAVSATLSVPVFLSAPDNALLPGSNPATFWQKVTGLTTSFFRVGFYEIAELAALDRVLLALLSLAVIASIHSVGRIESQYFLGVLLAVWLIGAINGTIGVNFRYQMPVLGFLFWVLAVNFSKFRNWILGYGLNVVGGEAQN